MAITPTPRFGMKQFSSGADPHPTRLEHNAMIGLIESNAALYSQGALSSRPTAGKKGRYHWATDTKRLYADDGTAWHEVSPIGGGGAGSGVVIGGAAAEGTAERAARADHTHDIPLVTVSANGAMLAADKKKLDAATAQATPDTLALRNAAGAVAVATPTSSIHATTKAYVDGRINEAAEYADDAVYNIPFASHTEYGHMTADDKFKLDKASSGVTKSALVMRDSNADAAFRSVVLSEQTGGSHAARKDYVDAQVAKKANTAHTHSMADITIVSLDATGDFDKLTTSGLYHGYQQTNWEALHYPINLAGLLEVTSSGRFVYQRYTLYRNGYDRVFIRSFFEDVWGAWKELAPIGHKHSGADITSGTVHPDRIANATSTLDGLMPKADKGKLNGATSATTGNTLVMRADNGQFQLPDPSSETHAVNKRYADKLAGERLEFLGDLGTGSIAKVIARGVYWNAAAGPVTVANGYPIDGAAGTLVIVPFGGGTTGSTGYLQREWTEWTSSRRFLSATNNGGATWSAWKEQALTTRATSSADGLMSSTDKATLDTATYLPTPGSLVRRHSTAGTLHVETGVGPKDAVNLSYVQDQIANHSHTVDELTAGDLTMNRLRLTATDDGSETSTKHALQIGADNATNIAIDNNEIIGRVNGELGLVSMPGGLWGLPTPLTGSTATNKDYVDAVAAGKANTAHTHSGADITSGTISDARIANATASKDGLLNKVDKAMLDAATHEMEVNTIVKRGASGEIHVGVTRLAANAARKDYVDTAIATEIGKRGVRSRWTASLVEPGSSGKLASFVLATHVIPDPGYPYHVHGSAAIEAGTPAGTRWDVALVINGTQVSTSRGDVLSPWYMVTGGTGSVRTGTCTVELIAFRQSGSGNFGLSSYNKFFHAMMLPAHDDEF